MRPLQLIVVVVAATALAVANGSAQHREAPSSGTMADFERRIQAYAELREGLAKGVAELDETRKPEEIVTAQAVLAAKVQAARAGAKRGDIFTQAIEEQFRRLLNPQFAGKSGQTTRGVIKDEGPGRGGFALAVNKVYPKDQPLGTVPPNILTVLPPLPEHIEYRFVDKHLILRDTQANLIVDFIANALA